MSSSVSSFVFLWDQFVGRSWNYDEGSFWGIDRNSKDNTKMRWNPSATDLFVRCRCSCARLRPHPYTHTRAYRHSNTSTHSHTLLWPPELNSNLRFWALPVGWGDDDDDDGGDGGDGDGDSAVRETAGCLNSPKVNVWSFFFAFFPLTRFSSFHLNNKRLFFLPQRDFFSTAVIYG